MHPLIQFPKSALIETTRVKFEIKNHEVTEMSYFREGVLIEYAKESDIFDFISEILLDGHQDFFIKLAESGISYDIMAEVCETAIQQNTKPAVISGKAYGRSTGRKCFADISGIIYKKNVSEGSMTHEEFCELWGMIYSEFFEKKLHAKLEKKVKIECIRILRKSSTWDELRSGLDELLFLIRNNKHANWEASFEKAFVSVKKNNKVAKLKAKNRCENIRQSAYTCTIVHETK